MKKRDILRNIICLVVGGLIGTTIALPAKYPEVRNHIAQAWTDFQLAEETIKVNLNLASMRLPESNADHGDTLEEVISGLRDEDYEYIVAFYGDSKLFEVTNFDEGRVTYDCSWPKSLATEMITVHNHPSVGYSFSYTDLDGFCRCQLYNTAIVVSDDAVYTLSASEGWPTPKELKNYLYARFGVDFRSDEQIAPTILADLERKGYVIVRRDGSSIGVGLTSKTVSELAEYFGLTYTVEYSYDETGTTSETSD